LCHETAPQNVCPENAECTLKGLSGSPLRVHVIRCACLCFSPHSRRKDNDTTRQEILDQVTQVLGSVPNWIDGFPDAQLEHMWGHTLWILSDSKLSARAKPWPPSFELRKPSGGTLKKSFVHSTTELVAQASRRPGDARARSMPKGGHRRNGWPRG
jgi:hypothetical protein